MTAPNPDPDPANTPGLEPGGGVPPGETPPAEGGMSEAGPRNSPPKGWAKGPLTVIAIIVLLFAAGLVAMALAL
ncbi:DUF6480 family protein [Streptomyces sp. NPDC051320]|uniref:DUF6480 family protein n=1 Tax=Streptomyces sp. NPDC051320 TaxID=3154644 RepID=UPI003441235F